MGNMRARAAGLLVHPTSLPGPHGMGDLGPATTRFLDWAAEAGQSVWQILPLGPTGGGDSPYSGLSVHAGNPWLISAERLVQQGWLARAEIQNTPSFSATRVEFDRVVPWKREVLHRSWLHFSRAAATDAIRRFEAFVEQQDQKGWLEEWALYAALREQHGGRPWWEWDPELVRRDPGALRAARTALAAELARQRYYQFVFFEQWEAVRAEAGTRGLQVLGDLPFYVSRDSADVWSRPELFQLDGEGRPLKVAGVPPDYFSADGQLWGHPLYRWDVMEANAYGWWIDRFRSGLRLADRLRLDHFRGFAAYWEVDAAAKTAAGGRWVPGPGRSLFEACRSSLGDLPFVAEDLGAIGEDVSALRRELGLPGMRVWQFSFDEEGRVHSPEHYTPHDIAYTGTHDNDTLRGWFDRLPPAARRRVLDALHSSPQDVVRRAIDALYASAAGLVILPLQDVFGSGSATRMNRPGTPDGNWSWRAAEPAFTLNRARRLRRLAQSSGRA